MAGNVKKGSITIFLALPGHRYLTVWILAYIPYLDSMTERFWKIMSCLHCMQVEKKNWIWLLYMMIFRLI